MSHPLRKNIAALEGYVPGEQPQGGSYVKLNTNENPYPPSPRVRAELRRSIEVSLRLYPDPLGDMLREQAAAVYGIHRDNVLVGNGSDELLSILLRCYVGKGDRVAYPSPTYTLYDTLVAIQDGERVKIEYSPDFAIPQRLYGNNATLTLLCNPNSPSGVLVQLTDIEKLARSVTGLLVVDEAYIDFAEVENASAVPLVRGFSNLVVLRSFSKSFSLAGMRVGLAFAQEEIIRSLGKVKDSYNVNRLSLIAGTTALEDLPWMQRNVKKIQKTRKRLTRGLKKLGFTVQPSQANFVMATRPGENLRDLYEQLKERRILVRYFNTPELRHALRITVGTPKEISLLLESTDRLLILS